MEPIIISFGTFLSTLGGGFFGLRHKEELHKIISFTAGVILGVVFFDIVPEMFAIVTENKLDINSALIALIVGFLAIHVLEKVAAVHGAHEEEYGSHRHPLVGVVGASGLIFHSFLDGIGIGLGFQVSQHVGILIACAVIAHDFSDGLNTVSLLLLHKNSELRAKQFLFLDAAAPVVGAIIAYFIPFPKPLLALYLGFFAGFLLYISASDLLPEAHSEKSSLSLVGLTILGVLFIFFVTRFT